MVIIIINFLKEIMASDIKYNISRPSRRKPDELRVVDMKVNYKNNAEGS